MSDQPTGRPGNTGDGDNYDPDIHDPDVSRPADVPAAAGRRRQLGLGRAPAGRRARRARSTT